MSNPIEKGSFEERWETLGKKLQDQFHQKPTIEAILYLIGINEFRGQVPQSGFTKEQKEDLMHVAVCTLLSKEGYYQLSNYDHEGWPHFETLKSFDQKEINQQEEILMMLILDYLDF